MPSHEPIIFLWSLSPWSSKITAYLALRGISYKHCEQPVTQPRPDIAALGVNYRRVPIVSVGRDIYCDSLLITEKLEQLYPESAEHKKISASNPTEVAIEKLLEKWTDVVVFKPAAAAIPSSLDLMKDPGFQKDREALWGRPWTKEAQDALRPAALVDLRGQFNFLETVLGDGRDWILGSSEPKLADIHACWIYDWLMMVDSFPEEFFNPKVYPRTFAWRDRYAAAISAAKEALSKPKQLEGPDAVQDILSSGFAEDELAVEADPSGLKQDQEVKIAPVDTGYSHSDVGKLVGLNANEAVLSKKSSQGGQEIHIHFPRWNYTIEPAPAVNGK